ncbi:MAG: S-adenosyl-l-methionine hydroxide adenosyltransferase family protein [Candidatus Hermodarchaeota archaeon]
MALSYKRIIGLITDFGARGQHYVSSMKGVILNINPYVNIVDVSHNITPFSIIEASFVIKTTHQFFPEGTVFAVVVDPGVGSSREILAIKTVRNYYFIGPNNGIFLGAFELNEFMECIEIKNEDYFIKPVSNTFHGRDIMAPIAANITKNIPLCDFGVPFNPKNHVSSPIIFNQISDNEFRCTVQYIDEFGNIVTNFNASSLKLNDGDILKIKIQDLELKGLFARIFQSTPKNSLQFLIGSSGFLELSKNRGNAALDIGVNVGDIINVVLPEVIKK